MPKRGQITEEIQVLARESLGREISQRELRLMPYVQYVMMNERRLDINRINSEEREILSSWRSEGWIEGGASPMSVSRKFWDAMSEILWHGYVNYDSAAEI